MVVDLAELRERDEPFELESDFTSGQLGLAREGVQLEGPAHFRLMVSVEDDRVRVGGFLDAVLGLACGRCLKMFERPLHKEFQLEYWPDPRVEREGEEFALSYHDLEVGFYRRDRLDLGAIISEQLVLEVPMKPTCRQECKGLCDQCGADLNEGDCHCERESLDPRLAPLSELKKRFHN